MKKKFFMEYVIPRSISIGGILIIVIMLFLYAYGQIHIFKTYGPDIGMIENILAIITCSCLLVPIFGLIVDVVELRHEGKKMHEQGNRVEKRILNSITEVTYNYGYKTSAGNLIGMKYYLNFEDDLFDQNSIYISYKGRKRLICGKLIVPALLMFIGGVKGLIILFFFMPDTFWGYSPW